MWAATFRSIQMRNKAFTETRAMTATRMPAAVATRASAMPGPTISMPACFWTPMARKASMMPTTVPNKPTNGAVAPTVPNSQR